MNGINRGAITIVPKDPFYDWVDSTDPQHPFPREMKSFNTYLIEDDFVEEEKMIKKYFKQIFENELLGMWTDPNDWPKVRSFKVFKEWFDYYVSGLVMDLRRRGITYDDYG